MTKATSHGLPRRGAGKDNLSAAHDVAGGKYAYAPDVAYSVLEGRGTLYGDGARVENKVTEPLLREFLTLLEEAQEELNRRWNGQESSGCRAKRV